MSLSRLDADLASIAGGRSGRHATVGTTVMRSVRAAMNVSRVHVS